MPILEESLIFICVAVILWLINSHHHTRQALIWWHERQHAKMSQKGDGIRNGLLQQSFVIRRSLELSALNSSPVQPPQHEHYLTTIENFHHSLKELSDYLLPAHLDDSLSLAIKHLLVESKLCYPQLEFLMDLPVELNPESHQIQRIILMVLEEILNFHVSQPHCLNCQLVSVSVNLKQETKISNLQVEFNYKNPCLQVRMNEYKYLCQTFQFLTFGKCWWQKRGNTEIWYFHWQRCKY